MKNQELETAETKIYNGLALAMREGKTLVIGFEILKINLSKNATSGTYKEPHQFILTDIRKTGSDDNETVFMQGANMKLKLSQGIMYFEDRDEWISNVDSFKITPQ